MQDFAKAKGIPISIEDTIVETEDEAEFHQFIGSPTIRIGGLDVDPDARFNTRYGFT